MAFAVGQGLAASAIGNTQVREYHSPLQSILKQSTPGGTPPGEPQRMHPPVVAGVHALKISCQEDTTSKPFLPAGVFYPNSCFHIQFINTNCPYGRFLYTPLGSRAGWYFDLCVAGAWICTARCCPIPGRRRWTGSSLIFSKYCQMFVAFSALWCYNQICIVISCGYCPYRKGAGSWNLQIDYGAGWLWPLWPSSRLCFPFPPPPTPGTSTTPPPGPPGWKWPRAAVSLCRFPTRRTGPTAHPQ